MLSLIIHFLWLKILNNSFRDSNKDWELTMSEYCESLRSNIGARSPSSCECKISF